MKDTKQKNIAELERLAKEVLRLKSEREQRRPLLIEFCGSPKSGKSTTINSLNIFLKRNGFKTILLTERASICPIENKIHPFFNIWTLSSAVAEIIKNIDLGKDKIDIIISDRGLFDSLCWFEWLNTNPSKSTPYLDNQAYNTLKDFVLMDILSDYLDLIYVFKVSPEISIKREYANLLTEKRGSIMTESILDSYNISIDETLKKYKNRYREVQEIRTDTEETDDNPNKVSYNVTLNILHTLKNLLIEKIGYVEISDITSYKLTSENIFKEQLKFGNRDKVESENYLQIIPIAVITNPERTKVLVVKKSDKRTSSDSAEKDKLLLYIGGHIRIEDKTQEKAKETLKIIKKALKREIQEEIGESLSIQDSQPFLIYSRSNEKSKKHLAVCFVIEMDLEDKKFKLTSDEFIMKTGTTKSGQIFRVTDLINDTSNKYEAWSAKIIKEVFKAKLPIIDFGEEI